MIFRWGRKKLMVNECHGLDNYTHSSFTPCICILLCADSKSPLSHMQIPNSTQWHLIQLRSQLFRSRVSLLAHQPPKSLSLEKQNCAMSKIKVDEVLRFYVAVSVRIIRMHFAGAYRV